MRGIDILFLLYHVHLLSCVFVLLNIRGKFLSKMLESVIWKALAVPPAIQMSAFQIALMLPVSKHEAFQNLSSVKYIVFSSFPSRLGLESKVLYMPNMDYNVELHPQPEIYSLSGSYQ